MQNLYCRYKQTFIFHLYRYLLHLCDFQKQKFLFWNIWQLDDDDDDDGDDNDDDDDEDDDDEDDDDDGGDKKDWKLIREMLKGNGVC